MARKKKGFPVNGWLVLDKPQGLTSTQALSRVRRLFNAQKAGHAGTLDPLATGVLPIAFGQATKTVSFAVDGSKSYRFKVRWGAETATDDSEGEVVDTSDARPTEDEIVAQLDRFVGEIEQVPPRFSAIKVDGNRAYDLAREGEVVELAARTVSISDLRLSETPDNDSAVFDVDCGKGTYVRAIARDLGRALGCLGHVCELRRTRVAEFVEYDAYEMGELEDMLENDGLDALWGLLRPVEDALRDLPGFAVSPADAALLARGQPILLRGRDAPIVDGLVYATCRGSLVALADARKGTLHPTRVFDLS